MRVTSEIRPLATAGFLFVLATHNSQLATMSTYTFPGLWPFIERVARGRDLHQLGRARELWHCKQIQDALGQLPRLDPGEPAAAAGPRDSGPRIAGRRPRGDRRGHHRGGERAQAQPPQGELPGRCGERGQGPAETLERFSIAWMPILVQAQHVNVPVPIRGDHPASMREHDAYRHLRPPGHSALGTTFAQFQRGDSPCSSTT